MALSDEMRQDTIDNELLESNVVDAASENPKPRRLMDRLADTYNRLVVYPFASKHCVSQKKSSQFQLPERI
jgi:hypothetical protein